MKARSEQQSDQLRLQLLVDCFNQLFGESENTRLEGGADEPFYQPAQAAGDRHILYFREDYFSSALHEIAHWCIAGKERRQLPDFGYWYQPEGRSAEQQIQFEVVEVRPQALEWHLSVASRQPFRLSADNISAGIGASEQFADKVCTLAADWCNGQPMPARGRLLQDKLAELFGVESPRCKTAFARDQLA